MKYPYSNRYLLRGSLGFILGISSALNAQTTMQVETGSFGDLVIIAEQMNARPRPIETRTFGDKTEGTFFFKDEWLPATISAGNGRFYRQIPVKLDLFEQHLYFLDKDGVVKELIDPLELLQINDSTIGKNHVFKQVAALPGVVSKSQVIWCEVLQSGSATLLKKTNKIISESIPYGTGQKTVSVRDAYAYYLEINGEIVLVKREKDLLQILGKGLPSISSFEPEGKGKEEQFASMVAIYNKAIRNN